jgi:hypothetical protein
MKPLIWKSVFTYMLLAFVAVSLAYAVVQEVRRAPSATAAEQPARAMPPSDAGLDALKGGQAAASVFYATYYHGNVRCPTCVKIEAYSKEAIETRFAKEIKAGKVAFRMVNYDEKGNEHFKKDYGLAAQSLIVSEVKAGKELRWANLEKVWDLTYDKDKFMAYVESEFKAFIKPPAKTSAAADDTLPASMTAGGEAAPSTPATSEAAAASAEHHIVAYYLHGNTRCPSCIKIESFADAAVHERFAPELEGGRLEWRVVNYEEPGNEHYWQDFELEVKTVVLQDLVGGEQVRYKRLDRVWDLLADENAFGDYIEEEVRQYLEGV